MFEPDWIEMGQAQVICLCMLSFVHLRSTSNIWHEKFDDLWALQVNSIHLMVCNPTWEF